MNLEHLREIAPHILFVLIALAGVAQLAGTLSPKLEGSGFNSQSVHIPGLQVPSQPGHIMRQWIDDSLSNQCFSPLSPSLPLSKTDKHAIG